MKTIPAHLQNNLSTAENFPGQQDFTTGQQEDSYSMDTGLPRSKKSGIRKKRPYIIVPNEKRIQLIIAI